MAAASISFRAVPGSIRLGCMGGEGDGGDRETWLIETGDYRDRVMNIADDLPNFAGLKLEPSERALVIYGVGSPPPELTALIEQAPTILTVVWHPSPFTRDELTEETLRLLNQHSGRLTGGGPRTDGTGLRLTTNDNDLLLTQDPVAALGAHYPVSLEYAPFARYA